MLSYNFLSTNLKYTFLILINWIWKNNLISNYIIYNNLVQCKFMFALIEERADS